MHRGQVCIECHLLRIKLDCFVVFHDSIWEVSSFVKIVAFNFLGLCFTLTFENLALLIRQCCFSLCLSCGFLLLSTDLVLSFALFTCLLVLFLLLSAFFAHLLQVDTSHLLENFHEARIHLDGLHEHLWVHHAHIEHVLELGVSEVGCELRIVLHPLQGGLTEGTAIATGTSAAHAHAAGHAAHASHARHAAHSAHAAHATHATHAAHTAHLTHQSLCELCFSLLEELFTLGVVGVLLNTFLIKLNSLIQLTFSLQSHSFALVSLRPIRLNLDALVRVSQRLLIILQLVVGGGSVSEDSVFIRCLIESLRVEIYGFCEVFCLKSVVSLIFEC